MAAWRAEHTHTLRSYLDDVDGPWVENNIRTHHKTLRRLRGIFPELIGRKLKDNNQWLVEKWRISVKVSMAQRKIPICLPDWRDSRQYPPASKTTSMQRWAWEFLRRNPDYQADYAVQAAIPDDGDPKNAEKVLAFRAKYHIGKMPNPASEYSSNVRRAVQFTSVQGPSYLPYLPSVNSEVLHVAQFGDVAVKFNASPPIKA
jgi:hypothetical protein